MKEFIITNRTLKKVLIGLIYLILFSFLVFLSTKTIFYYWYKSLKTEKFIPIEVVGNNIIKKGGSLYDVGFQIKNPNFEYGAFKFKYTIEAYDREDNFIGKKEGENFIMPNEIKYILVLNWQSDKDISRIKIKIDSIVWAYFKKDYYNWLPIHNLKANFSQPPEVGYLHVEGVLKNNSPYYLKKIAVNIILRNKNGNIIAINNTMLYDLKAKENRYFKALWNSPFLGVKKEDINLLDVEIYPEANFILAEKENKLF